MQTRDGTVCSEPFCCLGVGYYLGTWIVDSVCVWFLSGYVEGDLQLYPYRGCQSEMCCSETELSTPRTCTCVLSRPRACPGTSSVSTLHLITLYLCPNYHVWHDGRAT